MTDTDGHFVMDADYFYWTTRYDVGPLRSRKGEPRANGAVLDWSKTGSLIQRVPRSGGRPTTLAKIPGDWTMFLAIDERHLYWTAVREDHLWRLPKKGGGPRVSTRALARCWAQCSPVSMSSRATGAPELPA
jgi:hypothetical protein